MPRGTYYRTQAELVARLAAAATDPQIADRYNRMALEQLAKADDVERRAERGERAQRAGSSPK